MDINKIQPGMSPDEQKEAASAIRKALHPDEPTKPPRVEAFHIEDITVENMLDPAKRQHAAAAIMQGLREGKE